MEPARRRPARLCSIVTWTLLAAISGASFALPRHLSIPTGFAAEPAIALDALAAPRDPSPESPEE